MEINGDLLKAPLLAYNQRCEGELVKICSPHSKYFCEHRHFRVVHIFAFLKYPRIYMYIMKITFIRPYRDNDIKNVNIDPREISFFFLQIRENIYTRKYISSPYTSSSIT